MKKILLLSLITLLFTGCNKGPDTSHITRQLQHQINSTLGKGILRISTFKRRGGQNYTLNDDKRSGYIVYFTSTLQFEESYDSRNWTPQNTSALQLILGTTSAGITGIDAQGQYVGGELIANGLTTFIEDSEQWIPSSPIKTSLKTPKTVATDTTGDCVEKAAAL